MLSGSALRKILVVDTTASPPSMITSKVVATSGTGRGVPATNAPAMKARSGSVLVCDAIVMARLLQEIGKQRGDARDERADIGAAAEQVRVDHEREPRSHRKRRALVRFEQQLDRGRREAEIA